MQRLHASDAQAHWMASKIPSDQFLLYCFDSVADSRDRLQHLLVERSATIDDLTRRLVEVPWHLDYPYWQTRTTPPDILVHPAVATWNICQRAIAELFAHQVEPTVTPWRLHLFHDVTGAPRGTGPATVAVLQISHALADGRRSSDIARALFGDEPRPLPTRIGVVTPAVAAASGAVTLPWRIVRMIVESRRAYVLDRAMSRAETDGLLPPPALGRRRTLFNSSPDATRDVRMIVRDAADLRPGGVSVTVGALTAISDALSQYLGERDSPAELGAEVTLAKPGTPQSRNHFRNAAVDLHTGVADSAARAELIGESLGERRARAVHPAAARASDAQSAASNFVPAFLTRWGVSQFDASAVPDTVTGNTVVSSVARGAADLVLGGAPVRFTAGFPGLSPVMGVTHGVHGLGDTVTISVTSSRTAIDDPDAYAALLAAAIDDLRSGRQG